MLLFFALKAKNREKNILKDKFILKWKTNLKEKTNWEEKTILNDGAIGSAKSTKIAKQ